MTAAPLIVTGLAGLLGSRLLALNAGARRLASADITDGVDITDPASLARAFDAEPAADAVIHLAAFTNVSAAAAQEGDRSGACWRLNVEGTRNVAALCRARGLHLVHVSTDFVFDGDKDGAYTEADEPRPIEWYGRTKLEAENCAREAGSWTIIRLAFPYVAGAAPRPDLVRNIVAKLASGEGANLFSDQIITPTFTDDVARALLLLASEKRSGEVFHVVGSSSLSPYELGRKIAAEFGFDLGLVRAGSMEEYMKKDPRPRQRRLKIDNSKWSAHARARGIEPPVGIDEGLRRVHAAMAD